jgi:hypothetical protein
MPSVAQRETSLSKRDPNRGRPRKPLPPLSVRIFRWCELTGWGRSKTHDAIKAGRLQTFRPTPNGPREIPTSELVRLGYIKHRNELIGM